MTTATVNLLELPTLGREVGPDPGRSPVGQRLDLVEHIDVQLSVSLGNARMPIRDLFAVAPGSLIELDRSVDDPVDVILNGKVVARGYLVAVGDRFGVQISEISQTSG